MTVYDAIAIGLAIVSLFFVIALMFRLRDLQALVGGSEGPAAVGLSLGDPAPAVKLATIRGEEAVMTNLGHKTLLFFVTSSCDDCLATTTEIGLGIRRLQMTEPSLHVVVLSLPGDNHVSSADLPTLARTFSLDASFLAAPTTDVANDFEIYATPSYCLVDGGTVAASGIVESGPQAIDGLLSTIDAQ